MLIKRLAESSSPVEFVTWNHPDVELRVPSVETWASTTVGREIAKRSASQPCCASAMSVIAEKSETPRL